LFVIYTGICINKESFQEKAFPCPWKLPPIPGDFQGEAGSGPGQPGVAVVSLVIAGELDYMVLKGLFQL